MMRSGSSRTLGVGEGAAVVSVSGWPEANEVRRREIPSAVCPALQLDDLIEKLLRCFLTLDWLCRGNGEIKQCSQFPSLCSLGSNNALSWNSIDRLRFRSGEDFLETR